MFRRFSLQSSRPSHRFRDLLHIHASTLPVRNLNRSTIYQNAPCCSRHVHVAPTISCDRANMRLQQESWSNAIRPWKPLFWSMTKKDTTTLWRTWTMTATWLSRKANCRTWRSGWEGYASEDDLVVLLYWRHHVGTRWKGHAAWGVGIWRMNILDVSIYFHPIASSPTLSFRCYTCRGWGGPEALYNDIATVLRLPPTTERELHHMLESRDATYIRHVIGWWLDLFNRVDTQGSFGPGKWQRWVLCFLSHCLGLASRER